MSAGARPVREPVRVRRLVRRLLVLAALAGIVVAGLQHVRFLPVLTGSMSPYAPAGALVLAVPVSGDDVAVGDVVVFRPPAPFTVTGDHPVLHRVAELGDEGGEPYMVTKGDANEAADPWRVSTEDARFGRAVLAVPYVGRLLSGGSWAAWAFVFGGAALLTGLRDGRRADVGDRHGSRRGGRRTVHRDPHRQTISVTLDVPPGQWRPDGAAQRVGARARAALDEGLTTLGLVLRSDPVDVVQPDGQGGVRFTLTAAAGPG